ncbi:MAG: transcriptional regulator [Planctomycetota bacterium]|nr:MAG: transcriptional regulator [Planctomycetota bacterium]
MNKAELVGAVQSQFGSKAEAERAVGAVLEGIKAGLKKDQKVQIVGFGTFEVRKRKGRTGRNPQTGEQIKIKPSKTVGFKPGKALKDSI